MLTPNGYRRPIQCRATFNCTNHVERAIDPPPPEIVSLAPARIAGKGLATFAEPEPVHVMLVFATGRPEVSVRARAV